MCIGIMIIGSVSTYGSSTTTLPELDERYLPATSATECREVGGRWVPSSRVPVTVMSCAKPTTDAGKVCFRNDDCSSLCIRPANAKSIQNICYGWSSAVGECLRLAENPSKEVCFD